MKYLILVGDGMGDRPREDLGGQTVLQAANTPYMDRMAQGGVLGLARTIPPGMEPGSDTANMSLMGCDPAKYHTGRSPIEAAAMGVELAPGQVAFRCNLVNLTRDDSQVIMADYAAGHITSAEAAELIAALDQALGNEVLKFHPGVSYRHLLVWNQGPLDAPSVPPHDHTGRPVGRFLEVDGPGRAVADLVKASWPVLAEHPVNQARREKGLAPADSIWLWGQGTKPRLPTFAQRFGLTGFTISAVDLIRGLGVLTGLEQILVPGATGWLDTNYQGKVDAALSNLARRDLAFVHVEAPDEAGHSGVLENKIKAIEDFDAKVVGPLLAGMQQLGPHRILLATDHYTPLEVKTHTTEPIPFVIYDPEKPAGGGKAYNEPAAQATGLFLEQAADLAGLLIRGQ